MTQFKIILFFVLAVTAGFGTWYLIGWFLSGESNLFLWPLYGKILFLIFGMSSTSGIIDNYTNN